MKTIEKVIIAVLVLILVFQYVINSNMQRMNNDLSNRINSLQNNVLTLQSSVNSEINNVINRIQEENSVIKNVQWNTVRMENGMVTVRCAAGFNNISSDFTPYVLYRDKVSGTWTKMRMEPVEGLNYSKDISLDPKYVYEYQIFIDGETKFSGKNDIIPPYLYNYTTFRGLIQGHYDHRENNSKNHIVINLQMTSKVFLEPLQIKEAKTVLYSAGNKVDSIIMTTRPDKGSQDVKQEVVSNETALAVAAGDPNYHDLSADIDIAGYIKDIDRITIEVMYNDGHKAEKEVYPKTME